MSLVRIKIQWWVSPVSESLIPAIDLDMSNQGYVLISEEAVMVQKPDYQPGPTKLKSLLQRREALMRENAERLRLIDDQINQEGTKHEQR